MGAIATFDPVAFVARYPEFAMIAPATLTAYFNAATLYLANDGTGSVTSPTAQATLLNMLTAHVAALNSGVNGEAPSGLVGRIA